jgi:hypothetical protein
MIVVTQRHDIEAGFRRLAARELCEALLAEHLCDRAQPVRALGMTRRRQMIEACGMAEEKRCHARAPRVLWRAVVTSG